MGLLTDDKLDRSPVVANNAMNRERDLEGGNGYGRDLDFDLAAFLEERLAEQGSVRWLDLCCGTGRALLQAAERFAGRGLEIVGVDLVDAFAGAPPAGSGLSLVVASLREWEPERAGFDLITCVHGLHYLGDKLQLLARAAQWLAPEGRLVANLDLKHVAIAPRPGVRTSAAALRAGGLEVDVRNRRVSLRGKRELAFGLRYLGADDAAGPNYTGQAAVASFYERDSQPSKG